MSYFVDGIIIDKKQVSLTTTLDILKYKEPTDMEEDSSGDQILVTTVYLLTKNSDSYEWVEVVESDKIPKNYASFIIDISETETAKDPSKFFLKDKSTLKWVDFVGGSNVPKEVNISRL